jgi:hypothetical protein
MFEMSELFSWVEETEQIKGGDTSAGPKRAHGTAAAPVAVDVFDEHVACWTLICSSQSLRRDVEIAAYLDSHTLILVADFHIMYMDVRAPNVDPIKSTFIASSNNHVVKLTIGACIQHKMESRCWKNNVSWRWTLKPGCIPSTRAMS